MKQTREINLVSDLEPSDHHQFEAECIKKYIKGKRILDIGCWTGQFLSLIEDQARCIGIELDKKAVVFARKHRRGHYIEGSALKLPFKNNQFDVVTMWDVIEHIPKNTEEQALREAWRVLKRNGIFGLSTVTTHPLSVLLDPAFFLIGHRHYSKKQLYNFLRLSGFSVFKTINKWGIWTLLNHNLHLLGKHVFKKEFRISKLLKLVDGEYRKNGFVQILIIARKNDKNYK